MTCSQVLDLHPPCTENVDKGTYAVRNDMGVAVERSLGVTVLGLITGKVPDDQGLVAGCGEEHVGAVRLLALGTRELE